MSFKLIDAERGDLSVAVACAALNVSTSGYYAWRHRPASHRQRRDMVLLAHIRAEFAESNETYGSRHAEGVLCTTDACRAERKTSRKWLSNRKNRTAQGGSTDEC